MPSSRRHFFVFGAVQGVGFRWALQEQARTLALTGWTRNLVDGRVEVLAEGEKEKIDELEKRIKNNFHRWAEVKGMETIEEKPTGEFKDFEIKFS